MNRFSTLATLLTSVTIVASCGQLIGLSEFEKGEEEAEGGQGASGGKGGAGGSTGGKGGSSGKGGTGGKGGNGGKGGTTGGTQSEGGDGGAPEGGVGGSNGGNGGTGGNGGNGGSSAVGGDSGNGGTSGGGGASGGGGTAGTAGTTGCVELTPGVAIAMAIGPADPDFRSAIYDYAIDEQIGSSFDDILGIQIYTGTGFDGQLTGSFTLGTGIDDNYSSCARCIMIERDQPMIGDAGDTRFFGNSGTLVIDAASQHTEGRPIMTLQDVTLIEVTVDADTYESTPVQGGECYHIDNFSFSLPTAGWTCESSVFGDGFCTCGCGTRDLECDSPASDACDDCGVTGSCASSCLDIAADNNATCGAGVPAGWTCDGLAYGDGACSCGCGISDPDCLSDIGWACDVCGEVGACGDTYCVGIDVTQNWLCGGAWTCPAFYYDALDGCDCGCGMVDPDCADQLATTCEFCGLGSCASSACTEIDAADNSQCL